MALPGYLQQNFISIYGKPSIQNIVMPSLEYKFGVVDQIYTLLPNNFSIGDSVMFKGSESQPYVKDGLQYYLIEETKIILTENPSLP